jgi:hypothetical protein
MTRVRQRNFLRGSSLSPRQQHYREKGGKNKLYKTKGERFFIHAAALEIITRKMPNFACNYLDEVTF